jgi:hypothetical protein
VEFLKTIDFFGFHELINHAGQCVAESLGIKLPAEMPHLNRDITARGIRRDDVLSDIAAFEAQNTIDREIYVRALRIYDKKFA